jgi:hypothetical protein
MAKKYCCTWSPRRRETSRAFEECRSLAQLGQWVVVLPWPSVVNTAEETTHSPARTHIRVYLSLKIAGDQRVSTSTLKVKVLTRSYVSISSGHGVSISIPGASMSEITKGGPNMTDKHRSIRKTAQKALMRSPSSI